jgi:phosphatidylglycerophosphate synthase/putative flippase GtrA
MLSFALHNRLRGPYRDADLERRGSTWLLGMWLRHCFSWTMRPFIALLVKTRLPPAAITTLALLLATGAAAAMAAGRMGLGGWLFIAAACCDALDGSLARELKTAGPTGAVLDSVIDRYVDGVVFTGLAWFYRDSWVLFVVLLALVGSLVVPYVRAKGEAMGVSFPNVGLAQRPERVVVLGVSVALSPILEAVLVPDDPRPVHRLAVIGILIVAVTSHLTSLQRLLYARRALDPNRQRLGLLARGGLARNALSAAFGTVCDFALVVALVSWLGLSLPVATLLGCAAGATVSFATNRVWAFASKMVPMVQGARYLLVSMSSAALNSGLVAVLLLLPSIPYPLVWLVVRGLVFATWNYPLHRDYVFGPGSRTLASAEARVH